LVPIADFENFSQDTLKWPTLYITAYVTAKCVYRGTTDSILS